MKPDPGFPAARMTLGAAAIVLGLVAMFTSPWAKVLGLAVFSLGLVALFSGFAKAIRDPIARGPDPQRWRCVNCGYDARGIGDWKCPECGTVLTERHPGTPEHDQPTQR